MAAYSQYAVDFDGSNDYATAGNVLGFERNQPFSVAGWVLPSGGDGLGGYFIGKMDGAPTYRGWGCGRRTDGSFFFMLRSDDATLNRLYVYTSATGFQGAWRHVVYTYTGSSLSTGCAIYVDGVSQLLTVLTENLTGTILNTSSFWLGGAVQASSGWVLKGRMSETHVYNRALTAPEVAWLYNNNVPRDPTGGGAPTGLVSYWPMGDGDTYPTLTDNVGANNATMTNMASGDIVEDVIAGYTGEYQGDLPIYRRREGQSSGQKFFPSDGAAAGPTTYYKMRAIDDGNELQPAYITWVSTGSPDFDGDGFDGGTPTPIGSMVAGSATVVAEWQE